MLRRQNSKRGHALRLTDHASLTPRNQFDALIAILRLLSHAMTDMEADAVEQDAAGRKMKGRGHRDPTSLEDRYQGVRFTELEANTGTGPTKSVEGWVIFVTGINEEAQEDDVHEVSSKQATRGGGCTSNAPIVRSGLRRVWRYQEHLHEPRSANGEGPCVARNSSHERLHERMLSHGAHRDAKPHKRIHSLVPFLQGFVKGYALVEYKERSEAQAAITAMNGSNLLEKPIAVDWAFKKGAQKKR